MDSSVAEMNCVLNVNIQCEACKAKVYEILQNIYGVYGIAMDAGEGSVRICGKVNPNTILRVLENSGNHAEVKSIRFDGEVRENNYYHYGGDDYHYSSYEMQHPHPFFNYPDHLLSNRNYQLMPFVPPPPPPPLPVLLPPPPPPPLPVLLSPPPYPWQGLPPPPPLPLVHWMPPPPPPPESPPEPDRGPMGPLPLPSLLPKLPMVPPPDDGFKGETTFMSSNSDGHRKSCTIM